MASSNFPSPSSPHPAASGSQPAATASDAILNQPFGSYTLLARLAWGGMGEIFLAKQSGPLDLGRLVVIKRIHAHMKGDAEYVKMFFDEARLQSMMTSRHIAQIFDVGEIGPHLYMAMEYVRGPSWRSLVEKTRQNQVQIHPAHAASMMIQACRGLSYAHNLSDDAGQPLHIVHRDINPHNLLVSYDGEVKIIDFGIAKSEMSSHHTETGTIKGKFAYMSPEQSAAEPVDKRSDLFSLGICLFELLVGENPFRRANVVLSMDAIQRQPTPSLAHMRPECAPLASVVEKMLSKNPDARYQDCNDAADDLERILTTQMALSTSSSGWGKPPPLQQWLQHLFQNEIAEHQHLLQLTGTSLRITPKRPRPNRNYTGTGFDDDSDESSFSEKSRESDADFFNRGPSAYAERNISRPAIPTAVNTASIDEIPEANDKDFNEVSSETQTNSSGMLTNEQKNAAALLQIGESTTAIAAKRPPSRLALWGAAAGLVVVGATFGLSWWINQDTANTQIASVDVNIAQEPAAHSGDPDGSEPSAVNNAVNNTDTKDEDARNLVILDAGTADTENKLADADGKTDKRGNTEIMEKNPKDSKDEKNEQGEKTDKNEKNENTGKTGKDEKTDKTDKLEKPVKTETPVSSPENKDNQNNKATTPTVVVTQTKSKGTLTINAGGPFNIQGGGLSGRNTASGKITAGDSNTITVGGGDAPFRAQLRVRAVDRNGVVALVVSVDSDPWAIVRVDNIGRGKTPISGIDIPSDGRARLVLSSPQVEGTLSITVGVSP